MKLLQVLCMMEATEGLVDHGVDQAEKRLLWNGLPVTVDKPWGLGTLVELCLQRLVSMTQLPSFIRVKSCSQRVVLVE